MFDNLIYDNIKGTTAFYQPIQKPKFMNTITSRKLPGKKNKKEA